jgi:CobQ-like glutamine amidotransferase family enzyme
MGGAQDIQQEIVNKDLFSGKGEIITQMIRNYIPALFICGAYQFMGKFYKTADGKKLLGLGLFDLYTENPGLNKKRLIGNIVISNIKHLSSKIKIVGFENHGGRTYLANKSLALARVFKGYGNNGEDKTEGMVYKNAIGTYLHGPLFSKNPEIADWLIQKALEIKYKRKFKLQKLNDNLEYKAREKIIMKTV